MGRRRIQGWLCLHVCMRNEECVVADMQRRDAEVEYLRLGGGIGLVDDHVHVQ